MEGAIAASHEAGAAVTVAEAVAALGYMHRFQLAARFLGCDSVWAVELGG